MTLNKICYQVPHIEEMAVTHIYGTARRSLNSYHVFGRVSRFGDVGLSKDSISRGRLSDQLCHWTSQLLLLEELHHGAQECVHRSAAAELQDAVPLVMGVVRLDVLADRHPGCTSR